MDVVTGADHGLFEQTVKTGGNVVGTFGLYQGFGADAKRDRYQSDESNGHSTNQKPCTAMKPQWAGPRLGAQAIAKKSLGSVLLGGYLFTYKRENPGEGDNYFVDVYRFVMDVKEEDLHLQEEETDGHMFATLNQIKEFAAQGKFLHYDSIQAAFENL